ncbi:glycosyltransferase family 4 protein [Mesonia sp.]|uniref:glycosyltransferase family 4 protein n=1 Tax=Mesonia sp. TaxID=1960830 RepID=UPI0017524319|nr:glycosyltransferase family 4 protein [Mesonia sp.]HIB36732.1 glycosyltransferase [Mesonia sp.]HIO27196.1 glycosyltransferase [Flavobacteriaceae bacterium]
MPKLILIQTCLPDYRSKFINFLKEKLGNNFEVYSGESYFDRSIKSDNRITFNKLKNIYFLKRKLLFQKGHWYLLFSKNVLVLEMNPRIISNWLFLMFRKLFFRKTIAWGHAWPRAGKKSKSDFVRNLMRLLATEVVVYTHQQKEELQKKMPKKNIKAAPNSVYSKKEMCTDYSIAGNNIIYVGRMVADKKPKFLLKGFHQSLDIIPENTNLILVGDGEELQNLIDYTKKNKLENRVEILGHISEVERLSILYQKSLVSVSPGYVGLSITQSFGFGVPMIISRHENHSPEIEAVKEDFNAIYFETDNLIDFRKKLNDIFLQKELWLLRRKEIAEFCKDRYSIESMASTFIEIYFAHES